jgi:hypothetical protein
MISAVRISQLFVFYGAAQCWQPTKSSEAPFLKHTIGTSLLLQAPVF